MAGMMALLTDWLNNLIIYSMAQGPRCLRWMDVRESGPVADEFLATVMAAIVAIEVKRAYNLSSLCFGPKERMTFLALGSDLWFTAEV
jgi:hypothetical protein